jgi:hypothetical protein
VHREGEVLKEEHRADGTYLVANVGRSTAAAPRVAGRSTPSSAASR